MIRLIWQEIKFRKNAIIWWGLGLCFFPIVYLGIYPEVADEMAGLADLEIYKTMGVSIGGLEEWIGSILILFVPLLLCIFAIINGTGTIAGEEEDGRLEMLVTLPIPRWQIITSKALAFSISSFIILAFVSLVSIPVFEAANSQMETDLVAFDVVSAMISTWPLIFAVGMISMFLASFSARRLYASLIGAIILVIGYFGKNLSGSTKILEPFEPLFIFSYLDNTGKAVTEGQQIEDTIFLLILGFIAFLLAVVFFHRRKLTVGAWPWQRSKIDH